MDGWLQDLVKYGTVLLIVFLSSHLDSLLLTVRARHDYVQYCALHGKRNPTVWDPRFLWPL